MTARTTRSSLRTVAVVALILLCSGAGYGVLVRNPAPATASTRPIPTDTLSIIDLANASTNGTFAASASFEPGDARGLAVRRSWATNGTASIERTTFDGPDDDTTLVEYRDGTTTYRRYRATNRSTFERSLESTRNGVGCESIVRVDDAGRVYETAAEARESPHGVVRAGLSVSALAPSPSTASGRRPTTVAGRSSTSLGRDGRDPPPAGRTTFAPRPAGSSSTPRPARRTSRTSPRRS